MTAAEVQNPRHALAKAVRRVFYSILMFYVLGILIVGEFELFVVRGGLIRLPLGMLVPSTDGHLLQSSGTAAFSPFVLAMTHAGVKTLPCACLSQQLLG